MKDQIHKLKETGLSVCVLKGEHVDADFVVHFPLEVLRKLIMSLSLNILKY